MQEPALVRMDAAALGPSRQDVEALGPKDEQASVLKDAVLAAWPTELFSLRLVALASVRLAQALLQSEARLALAQSVAQREEAPQLAEVAR